jgi:perosamine synthetase
MAQKKTPVILQAVPNLLGNESNYLKKCVRSNFVASSGEYLQKFKKAISKNSGQSYVTLTSSGSTALHTSLIALSIKKGDMVLVPSYTFIATINAITLSGAEPFFVDIKEDTLNIDEKLIEKLIIKQCYTNKNGQLIYKKNKKKIVAVMPVFTFGLPADMKKINSICKKYNLKIIIDAACAIGSEYKGKPLARMGADLAVLSFNANKIITSGGGGAVITKRIKYHKKTELYSSNYKKFNDKYIFDEIGFNHRMNNIQAAIGFAQIEKLNFFLYKKKLIRDFYNKKMKKEIEDKKLFIFPEKKDRKSSNWLSGFIVNKHSDYKKIKKHLNKKNIQISDFWKPCHLQKPYINREKTSMKITNKIWKKVLILPSSTSLTENNLNFVYKSLRYCFKIT